MPDMSDERTLAQKLQALDQASKFLNDALPPMLWSFHTNLLAQGFDADQALTMTIAYMSLSLKGGI